MAREVSSPQLKLLPHPTCSSDRPHPPCSSSTTHLLHATTAAPRDGTGPGRGTPGPCPLFSLPSLLRRRSLPLAPLPLSLCRPHSLTRSHAPAALPGHRPCEAVGRPGRGAGRAGLSRSKAHFARWGEGVRLARGGVENPRSGCGPKSASRRLHGGWGRAPGFASHSGPGAETSPSRPGSAWACSSPALGGITGGIPLERKAADGAVGSLRNLASGSWGAPLTGLGSCRPYATATGPAPRLAASSKSRQFHSVEVKLF